MVSADPRAPRRDGSLAVMHVIVPTTVGGAERVVQMLAEGHADRGHRILVAGVTGSDPATHPFFESLAASRMESERLVVRPRGYLREYRLLKELMSRWRPSVVHTHGARADVIAGGAAASVRAPLVSTAHGYITRNQKDRLYQRMQLIGLRRGRQVIAVSEALRRRLLDGGVPSARLHLVPNALRRSTPLLDRERARHRLGLPPDGFVIGFVGRLGHEKGPDVLLEAIPTLDPDVRVSYLGSGAERSALERRAHALGIPDRVEWHGEVDGAGALLRAFDVLAITSRTEGTPIVALEAMHARIPIVATAVGGVPDLLRDGREGLLIPPEDPSAFVAAVGNLRGSAELASRLTAEAARRLDEEYGESQWLDRHEAIYAAAMGDAS